MLQANTDASAGKKHAEKLIIKHWWLYEARLVDQRLQGVWLAMLNGRLAEIAWLGWLDNAIARIVIVCKQNTRKHIGTMNMSQFVIHINTKNFKH